LLELGEGGLQVFAFALIFPTEMASFPYVGPTLASYCFGSAALEAIPFAFWVSVGGRFDLKELAQVVKMRLRSRTLLEG
jgi:hypothetical protein